MPPEIEQLRREINARKGDPRTRLHNICQGLERDKNDSPYSAESWDQLIAENDELRATVASLGKAPFPPSSPNEQSAVVTRLQAEVARVEGERDEARREALKHVGHTEYWRNLNIQRTVAHSITRTRAESAASRIEQLTAALKELVRLKDMEIALAFEVRHKRMSTDAYIDLVRQRDHLNDTAWAAARAIQDNASLK